MAKIKLTEDITPFKPEIVNRAPLNEGVTVNGSKVRGLMILEGIIQRYDVVNGNGRKYPKGLFERVLGDADFKKALAERSMLGHLEHPEDGQTLLSRVPSHVMLEVKDRNDGSIYGSLLVLDTSTGRDLAAIVEAGCTVGISSRGEGEVARKDGIEEVIAESYVLSTWDIVHNNSVPGAKLRQAKSESGNGNPAFKNESASAEDLDPEVRILEAAKQQKGFQEDWHREEDDSDVAPSEEEDTAQVVRRKNRAYGIKVGNKVIGNYPTPSDASEIARRSGYKVLGDVIEEANTPERSPEGNSGNSEFEEYLYSQRHQSDSKQKMSKITEMRSLSLEVNQLPEKGSLKKLDFPTRMAFYERVTGLSGKIRGIMKEDTETESLGGRLLKKLKEFEDELDDVPAEDAPPVEGEGEGGEEGGPEISSELFFSVVSPIFQQYCPDCPEDKMQEYINELHASFSEDGTYDFQAMIARAQEELEGEGDEGEGGDEDDFLDITDDELREAAFKVNKKMQAELKELRESKVGELRRLLKEARSKMEESAENGNSEKLTEMKKLLKESAAELERTKDYDKLSKKLTENVELLREASDYITGLSENLEKAVELLDENDVEHDIDLEALMEADDASVAAAETAVAAEKKKAAANEEAEARKKEREARRKRVAEGKQGKKGGQKKKLDEGEETPSKKEGEEEPAPLHESAVLIHRHRKARNEGTGLL